MHLLFVKSVEYVLFTMHYVLVLFIPRDWQMCMYSCMCLHIKKTHCCFLYVTTIISHLSLSAFVYLVVKEVGPQQAPSMTSKAEPNASFKCLFSLWRPDAHSPSGVKQALVQIEPRKPEQHCLCGSLNRTFEGEVCMCVCMMWHSPSRRSSMCLLFIGQL